MIPLKEDGDGRDAAGEVLNAMKSPLSSRHSRRRKERDLLQASQILARLAPIGNFQHAGHALPVSSGRANAVVA